MLLLCDHEGTAIALYEARVRLEAPFQLNHNAWPRIPIKTRNFRLRNE